MRVFAYLHYYPPYRYVGGELMTADLMESLVQQGHEAHVFAEHIDEPYERNGVRVRLAGRMYREYSRRYDAYITHPEIRVMMARHIDPFLPYIGIVHNTQAKTMRSLDRKPPTLTIANSEFTAGQIPSVAHRTQMGVYVMHPPTLITGTVTSPETITMINLSPDKGADILCYLAKKHPHKKFLAVTGGHGEQVTDLPRNVCLVPPTGDMASIYQRTRVLLMPSRSETYGKVIAEAACYGIPILASDLPATREAGGDAPVYIDYKRRRAWDYWLGQLDTPKVFEALAAASQARGEQIRAETMTDLQRWEELVRRVVNREYDKPAV